MFPNKSNIISEVSADSIMTLMVLEPNNVWFILSIVTKYGTWTVALNMQNL